MARKTMSVPEISPENLAARLKGPETARPILVDVRTPEEHATVALPGSMLLPLQELESLNKEVAALAGKEVVVYCHHGVRSRSGAAYLQAHGVTASSLAGGIDAYAVRIDPKLKRY
jgi:rhodanese-related sulfurtransferase